jgi:hypothetical protein
MKEMIRRAQRLPCHFPTYRREVIKVNKTNITENDEGEFEPVKSKKKVTNVKIKMISLT